MPPVSAGQRRPPALARTFFTVIKGGRPPGFHPEAYKQRNTVERACAGSASSAPSPPAIQAGLRLLGPRRRGSHPNLAPRSHQRGYTARALAVMTAADGAVA